MKLALALFIERLVLACGVAARMLLGTILSLRLFLGFLPKRPGASSKASGQWLKQGEPVCKEGK